MSHTHRWLPGNHVTLLENGDGFYPKVFDAIAHARREVLLETFILFEDKVGLGLHEALLAAARRGVQVHVLIDGFGSPDLSDTFIAGLTDAGVHLRSFDPQKPLFGLRSNLLRRMHRKIVVIDGELAFVGGINYSADHLLDFGPEAKQDYAVMLRGPIVNSIHAFARGVIDSPAPRHRWRLHRRPRSGQAAADTAGPAAGPAEAFFVTRDNRDHRDDIERIYRVAIRSARRRVVIANAYFFPGYRFLRELRRAARRGVEVRLILQGTPDMAIVKLAAELLHDHLLRSGVRIFEYCDRPFHGKVALVDDRWSTVGSSNLDPLSLSLNLEANVVIRDPTFNQELHAQLDRLMQASCREVLVQADTRPTWWQTVRGTVVFHVLRHFPRWASWLPTHAPSVVEVAELNAAAAPARAQGGSTTAGTSTAGSTRSTTEAHGH